MRGSPQIFQQDLSVSFWQPQSVLASMRRTHASVCKIAFQRRACDHRNRCRGGHGRMWYRRFDLYKKYCIVLGFALIGVAMVCGIAGVVAHSSASHSGQGHEGIVRADAEAKGGSDASSARSREGGGRGQHHPEHCPNPTKILSDLGK